ncbi:MAG: autotransporter-associated beta strand repeat-containing protein [Pirellulales bacterium]
MTEGAVASVSLAGSTATNPTALLTLGANTTLSLNGPFTFVATNNNRMGRSVGGTLRINSSTTTFTVGDSTHAEAAIDLDISSVVAGESNFSFVKGGTGTLKLSAANTYRGKTWLQAGVTIVDRIGLVTADSGNLGGPAGDVTMSVIDVGNTSSAATIRYVGAGETTDRPLNLVGSTGGLVLEANGTGALTWSGNLTNTVDGAKLFTLTGSSTAVNTFSGNISDRSATFTTALTKTGTTTWTVSGNSSFTGAVTVASGKLNFTTLADIGTSSSLGAGGTITIGGAGTLAFIGGTSQSSNRPIVNTASGFVIEASGTGGASIEFRGLLSGPGHLVVAGSGKGIISGGISQPSTSADLVINGGDWTVNNAPVTIADDIIVAGASSILRLNVTSGVTQTSTSAGLYAQDGGTVILGGNNVVSKAKGLFYILPGYNGGTGTIDFAGYNIDVDRIYLGNTTDGATGILKGPGSVTLAADPASTAVGMLAYRGTSEVTLIGTGSIWKTGSGIVTLKGANNLTAGNTQISAGGLVLDFTLNNSAKLRGALEMRGGTSLAVIGSNTADAVQSVEGLRLITSAGASYISVAAGTGRTATLRLGAIDRTALSGSVDFSFTSQAAITTTLANGAGTILGGWATANGSYFAATGSGTAEKTITAYVSTPLDNTYSWTAGIDASDAAGYTGTVGMLGVNSLRLGATGSQLVLDPGSTLTIASGGVLGASSLGAAGASISGGSIVSGTTEVYLYNYSTAGALTISANLTAGTVVKSGPGTIVLTGTNTFAGRFYVQEGTVVTDGTGLSDTGILTLYDRPGVVVDLNNLRETIGPIEGYGSILVGSGELTLNYNSASLYNSVGQYFGTGRIVKSGTGIQTFSGVSTGFTGDVVIRQGTLRYSAAGAMTAASFRIVNPGSQLHIVQDGDDDVDRVGNTSTVTMAGGSIRVTNNNDQSETRQEFVGNVILSGGHNVVSLEPQHAAVNTAVRLNAASLTRRTMRRCSFAAWLWGTRARRGAEASRSPAAESINRRPARSAAAVRRAPRRSASTRTSSARPSRRATPTTPTITATVSSRSSAARPAFARSICSPSTPSTPAVTARPPLRPTFASPRARPD